MFRLLMLCCAAAAALPLLLTSAALPERAAVDRGVAFIRTTQQPDGGFGGFGPGQTMDAIYALRAAGVDPRTVATGGKSPADFLLANAGGVTSPGLAAKFALGARAMEMDPRNAGGVDLVAIIQGGYDPASGRFAGDDFGQAIAMVGLAGSGVPVPTRAVLALRSSQVADGGWGFGGSADPDSTAIVLQALLAAGIPASDQAVVGGIRWLRANQGNDGGWGFDPDASNASSTAFVVQALLAAGEAVEGATYRKGAATPVSFLLSQQLADGSFAGFDAAFATNQALPALAGRTFVGAPDTPIRAAGPAPTPPVAASPAPSPAPAPPSTGSGSAAREGGRGFEAAAAVAVLVAGAAGLAAARRARG